ncbi:MAG: alpha-ketoacid dehydrogenase subunit beta [Acidobacteria bacterium]|nr:alpha-ketoacid dehydrogenase subunit beta [Acidobacteriota bacterium]
MREVKYWKAFNEAIAEEMRRDPDIIYLAEDARGAVGGPFAMAKGLEDEFGGSRVFDTPDSEAGFIGVAIGAAMTGLRPVVDISFSDFLLVAADQIVNQMAKIRYMTGENYTRLPIVIHTMSGAGMRAGSQHSQSLESWFVHVPGLKLVAPSNGYDLKGIMKSAIRDDDPVIVWLHKAMLRTKASLPDEEYLVPIGKGKVAREGNDVTVVGVSHMVNLALSVAQQMAKEGIGVEVIDPISLSPLDKNLIVQSVRKTGRLVTVHEAPRPCAIGAEIAAVVFEECFDYLEAPVRRVSGEYTPIPYSPTLEDAYMPNARKLEAAIREVLQ